MFPASPVDWSRMPSSSSLKVATPPVPAWVWEGYAVAPNPVDTDSEITKLVNAQMRQQQNLNATGVTSDYVSLIGGGLYQTGTGIAELPWKWIGLGVGLLAFMLVRR